MKKIPQRTCIGCGSKKEKKELLRIVRSPEGEYALDRSGRRNGRGAYLCPSADCFVKAGKKKAFQRSFKEEFPETVYQALLEECKQLAE